MSGLTKCALRTLIVFAFSFGHAALAASDPNATLHQQEQKIAEAATQLLRAYDSRAFALIDVDPVTTLEAMPGTGLTYKAIQIDGNAVPLIKAIHATVFAAVVPLPASPRAALEKLLKRYASEGGSVDLVFEKIPERAADLQGAGAVGADTDRAAVVKAASDAATAAIGEALEAADTREARRASEAAGAKTGGDTVDTLTSISDPKALGALVLRHPITSMIAVFMLAIAATGGIFLWLFSRVSRRTLAALDAGTARLAQSLESASGNAPRVLDVGAESKGEDRPLLGAGRGDTSGRSSSSLLGELPDESLAALMADCYWGERDAVAAWYWSILPAGRRLRLVAESRLFFDYAVHLLTIEPEVSSYESDPYYLNPLPIAHLANDVLTDAARRAPELLLKLPPLRADALDLSLVERLELMGGAADGLSRSTSVDEASRLRALEPSTSRSLRRKARLQIRSLDEESLLLALPQLDPELGASVMTLGWLAQLEDGKIHEILERYSAQDLASAWIGPEDVLARLGGCLPSKKLGLINTYAAKIGPSRESPTFRALHAEAVALRFGGAPLVPRLEAAA